MKGNMLRCNALRSFFRDRRDTPLVSEMRTQAPSGRRDPLRLRSPGGGLTLNECHPLGSEGHGPSGGKEQLLRREEMCLGCLRQRREEKRSAMAS